MRLVNADPSGLVAQFRAARNLWASYLAPTCTIVVTPAGVHARPTERDGLASCWECCQMLLFVDLEMARDDLWWHVWATGEVEADDGLYKIGRDRELAFQPHFYRGDPLCN